MPAPAAMTTIHALPAWRRKHTSRRRLDTVRSHAFISFLRLDFCTIASSGRTWKYTNGFDGWD